MVNNATQSSSIYLKSLRIPQTWSLQIIIAMSENHSQNIEFGKYVLFKYTHTWLCEYEKPTQYASLEK